MRFTLLFKHLSILTLFATTTVGNADPPLAPLGPEFPAGSSTGAPDPLSIRVDVNSDDNFVVVWRANYFGTDRIRAQRLDGNGTRVGAEIPVADLVGSDSELSRVSVGLRDDGEFVIVWTAEDAHTYGIVGQRFRSNGTPIGMQFQVNTYTTAKQEIPDLSLAPNGNFVVVWDSDGQDGWGDGVFGQRFQANGSRLGGEFQVNTYTTSSQDIAYVQYSQGGDRFIVIWECFDCLSGSPGEDVKGRLYSGSGSPLTGEFLVNTYTTGYQVAGRAAFFDDGSFLVVWSGPPFFPGTISTSDVHGRYYNANGTPNGNQFFVNTIGVGVQIFPSIGGVGDRLLVSWFSQVLPDQDTGGFAGRIFDKNGPVGDQFNLSSPVTEIPGLTSDVAANERGRFVVGWTGYYSNYIFDRAPMTRLFCRDSDENGSCDLLFVDGFESGDTSQWAIASP